MARQVARVRVEVAVFRVITGPDWAAAFRMVRLERNAVRDRIAAVAVKRGLA